MSPMTYSAASWRRERRHSLDWIEERVPEIFLLLRVNVVRQNKRIHLAFDRSNVQRGQDHEQYL